LPQSSWDETDRLCGSLPRSNADHCHGVRAIALWVEYYRPTGTLHYRSSVYYSNGACVTLGPKNSDRRDSNLYQSLLDSPSLKTRTNELRFTPACTIILLFYQLADIVPKRRTALPVYGRWIRSRYFEVKHHRTTAAWFRFSAFPFSFFFASRCVGRSAAKRDVDLRSWPRTWLITQQQISRHVDKIVLYYYTKVVAYTEGV